MEFFKKYRYEIFLAVIFFLFIALVILFKSSLFTSGYDSNYWKDRYEHSRYQIPLSQRGIGDSDLYAYGGYSLLNGEDPTKIVYDKPAFGIFLIGLPIKLFNNALLTSLFFGVGSIILFYFLSKRLLNDKFSVLAATLIFFLSPFIFSHFYVSLLDLPQLFFILLNVVLFYEVLFKKSNHKLLLILISGLSLGLASQVKIPIFLPIIFMLQIGLIIYRREIKLFINYILGFLFSGIVAYSFYLFYSYSFFDFLRIQKYIISLYTNSKLPFHPHAIWQFLFTGNFPDVVTGIPRYINEWSIVILFFSVTGIIFAIFSLFIKNNLIWKGLSIYVISILLMLTYISAYPRHLFMIFPFLILISFNFLYKFFPRRIFVFVVSLIVLFSLVNSFVYLNPKPTETLNSFYSNYGNFYFQDVYENDLANINKPDKKRQQFYKDLYNLYLDANIYSIEIKELENNVGRFNDYGEVKAEFTYNTYFLGSYKEIKTIPIIKENDEWKIIWDWDYVINEYLPGNIFISERDVGRRGSIIDGESNILAEDTEGYLVEFNPTLMDSNQEEENLNYLNSISGKGKWEIQNAYLENIPNDTYAPIVTNFIELSPEDLSILNSINGIRLKKAPVRVYSIMPDTENLENTFFDECCTKIYSSTNYHGIDKEHNVEYIYDSVLSGFDGGFLIMHNNSDDLVREIIKKNKKDGKNLNL